MLRVAALLCTVLFCAGCSAPPQKEIDHAQGALDAARAAGADVYAKAQLTEASSALQQSHDAVGQRDYRLALSRAVDASQRAQEAAREAADGKARARSEAESAVHTTDAALLNLQGALETASAGRIPETELRTARQTLTSGRRAVQKARTALADGDYLDAGKGLKATVAEISAQTQAVEEATKLRSVKRRR